MDFSRTPQQLELFRSTRDFAADVLNGDVSQRDQNNLFSRSLWKACADHGVLSWPMATTDQPHTAANASYLMEALGQGCEDNGLTFALGAQMWSVQLPLQHFGSQELIDATLPGLISGETIGAFAITEAGSGSDAFALQTTATLDGDHYLLNGEKTMITLAPVADVAIVFATTNPAVKQWGISAFLVDAKTPGFTASENRPKMGLRTVPFGDITLDNCRVPASCLLAREGAGSSIFSYSQSWERSLVLAPQLGAMQRLIDDSVAFANNRHRSNSAIGKHQAVSHRIADMRIRLETSRLLLYKIAWLLDQGQQNLLEAAIAKTHISEAFVETCHDALSIHGGSGYITATGIERNLRDAVGATIYGGTVDIQRNIIAGMTGV